MLQARVFRRCTGQVRDTRTRLIARLHHGHCNGSRGALFEGSEQQYGACSAAADDDPDGLRGFIRR
jgi:hypothetical protein